MIGGKAVKEFGRRVVEAMRKTSDGWPRAGDSDRSIASTLKVIALVLENVLISYNED